MSLNPGVKRPRLPLDSQDDVFRSGHGYTPASRADKLADAHANRGKAAALAEAAHMTEWLAGEDAFALRQSKQRAILRTREARPSAIDPLVVNLLFVEQDPEGTRGDAEALLDHERVHATEPVQYIDGLDGGALRELAKDVVEFVTLEGHKRSRRYWQHVQLLCCSRQEAARRPSSTMQGQIAGVLAGKKAAELQTLEQSIEDKLESEDGVDVDYWTELLEQCRLRLARAELVGMYRKVLKAAGKGASQPPDKQDGADAPRRTSSSGARPLPDKASVKAVFEAYDHSPAALELFRFASSTDLRGQEEPHNRPLPEHLCSREAFERHVDDPTTAIGPRVPWQKLVREGGAACAVKPRFYNKRVKRHEWNNYNRGHYSTDRGEIPPSAVVGYEFKVFYPELAAHAHLLSGSRAASGTPTYKLERIDPVKEPERFEALQSWDEDASPAPFRDPQALALAGKKQAADGVSGGVRGSFLPSALAGKNAPQVPTTAHAVKQEYCLLRFTCPAPPYADVCFRIVDLPWDHSSRYQAGFRASFDDGVLGLRFKFKKIIYRT